MTINLTLTTTVDIIYPRRFDLPSKKNKRDEGKKRYDNQIENKKLSLNEPLTMIKLSLQKEMIDRLLREVISKAVCGYQSFGECISPVTLQRKYMVCFRALPYLQHLPTPLLSLPPLTQLVNHPYTYFSVYSRQKMS